MKNHILRYALMSMVSVLVLLGGVASAAGPARVKAAELKAMLDAREAVVLIDVRTPAEHAEAHIPGSVLMPLHTLGGVTELPDGGRVILYCRSGIRSHRALNILTAKGFKGLADLEGGINAWMAIGGPVAAGR